MRFGLPLDVTAPAFAAEPGASRAGSSRRVPSLRWTWRSGRASSWRWVARPVAVRAPCCGSSRTCSSPAPARFASVWTPPSTPAHPEVKAGIPLYAPNNWPSSPRFKATRKLWGAEKGEIDTFRHLGLAVE